MQFAVMLCALLLALQPATVNARDNWRSVVHAPAMPTEEGGNWAFFRGTMKLADEAYYDPHATDYEWAYSVRKPLPAEPRLVVHMHGSGGGKGSVLWAFAPSQRGDIEVRAQDAETYDQRWREWWMFGSDGKPYPGRRIAAALAFVTDRYQLDTWRRGIVLDGTSMGGAGAVVQTMILPAPWRERVAYATGRVGIVMPRRVAQKSPGQYVSQPPDTARHRATWDGVDFALVAQNDPVVRGMHYRHVFSSNDQFSAGPTGNTQLEFVNLVEEHRIGGAFAWVSAGHDASEPGVRLPDMTSFEVPQQDVTLDRAHPAFTLSTGNYPLTAANRRDARRFPRGHYNMGLLWDHAGIVDTHDELIFPIRYQRRTGLGKDIPDQPRRITVSVTPRRASNFVLRDGDVVKWTWNGSELSGQAKVYGDTLTIDRLPLVSHQPFKMLRIYRE
jgi:hypothetical protein